MIDLMAALVFVGVLAIAYCLLLLVRNEAVARYLKAVNDKVFEDQIAAINEGRPARLEVAVLDRAIDDYGRIVDQWWRWFHIRDYFPPEYRP